MRRLLFVMFISLIFLLSEANITVAYEKEIKTLSSTMAENIVKASKKTIAVVDFVDLQGNVTELGRFLAEEFSVAFAGAGKGFEVVDRTHLKSILAEHKLSATGIIDPQTARKLGQVAGVDALITGTITPFGDSIRLSVKILDTATAKVIGASSGDIAKTKAIEELLVRGIETSQSLRQEPSTPSVSFYPASSPSSKKIGHLIVTMKKIVVSRDRVSVYLEFVNQSQDTEFRLGKDYEVGEPTLVDEKGNTFSFESRLSSIPYTFSLRNPEHFKNFGFTLPPNAVNEMAIIFKNEKKIDIKELGSYFAVSLKYRLYNSKDKLISDYNVSFTDIKAQMPK